MCQLPGLHRQQRVHQVQLPVLRLYNRGNLPEGIGREAGEEAEAEGMEGRVQSEKVRTSRMWTLMSSAKTGHAYHPRGSVDIFEAVQHDAHCKKASHFASEQAEAMFIIGERRERSNMGVRMHQPFVKSWQNVT